MMKELLLETGNVLDEMYRDKTANLILPSSGRTLTKKLDVSIKTVNDNLDSLLVQLNDVQLWQAKLKEDKAAAAAAVPQPQQLQAQQLQPQQHQQQQQQQQGQADVSSIQDSDILSDINDFLAQVPDGDLTDFDGNLQDNINELLNEDYTNIVNMDNGTAGNEDYTSGFDNNIFDEIDSMLNM